MRWFGAASLWFQHISQRSPSQSFKIVFLLFSIPCFKISNFCFERAYFLNQRKLRLLGGEDLFLKLYDRALPSGGISHVLYGLRDIKHRLECADPRKYLSDHIDDPASASSRSSI